VLSRAVKLKFPGEVNDNIFGLLPASASDVPNRLSDAGFQAGKWAFIDHFSGLFSMGCSLFLTRCSSVDNVGLS
jgi:hypothetical protein